MRYEVFTLGKHFLQVHTSKGFTLFANAKLNPNGEVVSYTDKLIRRGGTWVIDTWKFLTVKYFPENPIYCAVFGFADDDTEVHVTATDIDVDSISGVNGQLVDVGNISLPENQSLRVSTYGGVGSEIIRFGYEIRDNKRYLDEVTRNLLHERFQGRAPSLLSFHGTVRGTDFCFDGKNDKFVIINDNTRTVYDVCLLVLGAIFSPSISYPFYIESLSNTALPSDYKYSLTYQVLYKTCFCEVYDNGKVYSLIF